jgi:iron complex outermembrane recepter protein
MRGFSQGQVRLLFDGLVLGPTGFVTRPRDSWNLDRIEILKGPASVLYGEGAVAGAVNLVTKRPLRGASGSEAFLSYGSFNTLRAGVGSGGTLGTDNLYYRVDLSYQNADSFNGI